MKKILLTFMSLIFCSIASADCRVAYKEASYKRDVRNEIIVGAALIGTGVGTVLVPAATSAFAAGYMLLLTGVWPTTDFKRQGEGIYNNHFDKLLLAFKAAENNLESKYLSKIIVKSIEKAGIEPSPESEAKARAILVKGFEDETFCPILKVKENGLQKRTVFNASAVIDYVALNF